MNARRIEITLSQERWEQLEAARGHEPRAAFIKRALESALGSAIRPRVVRGASHPGTTDPPAPTRAPKTARELAMERQAKLNEAKS